CAGLDADVYPAAVCHARRVLPPPGSCGGLRIPMIGRSGMMQVRFCLLLILVLSLVASASPVGAQTPAPTTPAPTGPTPAPGTTPGPATSEPPRPPREPLTPPTGIRPFPTPLEIVGRELGLEEAVNIGLENAPVIVARIGDYIAAQQRGKQALSRDVQH